MEPGAAEGPNGAGRPTCFDSSNPYLAITQIAVYDAVNGILGGSRPLLVDLHGPQTASADAAAAAAARTALDALLPSQRATIDDFFQTSLTQLGSGRQVTSGVRFGQKVAERALAARATIGLPRRPRCSLLVPVPVSIS